MTIRSENLNDGQRVEKPARISPENIAVAAALVFFGGLAWIIGGKFTIEGWATWLNHIGAYLGIDGSLQAPRGWTLVGTTIVVGVIYSFVELRIRSRAARTQPLFWLVWIPIILTDVGSTFFGLQAVAPTDPLVVRQVAAIWPLAALIAAVLTFVPEYMILGAWHILRRRL